MPHDALSPLLLKLDRAGAHIVYNTSTKEAILREGDFDTENSPISTEDLLSLFEKAWIARYDSHDTEHQYRLTEAGRKASRGSS